MKIINIGGPQNAGKSTVSKLLNKQLPNSVFIEVDDLLTDEEHNALPDMKSKIAEHLRRLYELLEKLVKENKYDYVIFAYPMGMTCWNKINEIAGDKSKFIVITLNPEMSVCMTNRGTRELNEHEIKRIPEMYAERLNSFIKSDFIIDNTKQIPQQTVSEIISYLSK